MTNEFGLQLLDMTGEMVSEAKSGDHVEDKGREITLTIDGKPFARRGRVYSAWKVQRMLDVYGGLSASDRTRADEFLGQIGALDLARSTPDWRLEKQDYQVLLA